MPFNQRFLREIAAARIAETFPHAQVLITIREQNAILQSMYSEYLRYGNSSSLEAFLSQETGNPNIQPLLDLSYYEWDRFIDIYAMHFPSDRILAVPMEWGLANPNNYTSIIEKQIGHPLDVSEPVQNDLVERKSLSTWALAVLRQANKTQPQDTRYLQRPSRLSPGSLAHYADRLTPASARARGKEKMKKIIRETISDRYRNSNARLQEKISFPLESLSYQIARR